MNAFDGVSDDEDKEENALADVLFAATVDVEENNEVSPIRSELRSILLPHQIEGVSFMYEKVTKGDGCILAHAMGLGKTLQTLTLCDIFHEWKVVCVLPVTLMTVWDTQYRKFDWRFNFNTIYRKSAAESVIDEWEEKKGLVTIGYELYSSILNGNSLKLKMSLKKPDMVIFDEGHRIKNLDSKLCVTLNGIECTRRIILSGYPLQNNLLEYWSMMQFIKDKHLGDIKSFTSLFVVPIQQGLCTDSSVGEVVKMKERAYVLNELLSGFVHRESKKSVDDLLPRLTHYVVLVKMTDLQKSLVTECDRIYGRNALAHYSCTLKIMAHPDLVNDENSGKYDDDDDELQDLKYSSTEHRFVFPADYVCNLIENSPKLILCNNILNACIKVNDKVVIFSQSLATLDYIETFLESSPNYKWFKGWNYFRIDGSTNQKDRSSMLKEFNENENIVLFLMSMKTCAVGLDLTSANRIILFDSSWNPCLDLQAVSRVHRFGQTKPCFVYRLITDGCLEKSVYDRQINKEILFAKVVDTECPLAFLSKNETGSVWNISEKTKTISDYDQEYSDFVLRNLCEMGGSLMSNRPFEHCPFVLDKDDLELSDNEKVSAMEAYQNILATQSDPEFEHEESLTKDFAASGKKITRKRSSMRTGMKSKRVASAAAVKKALGEKSIAETDVEKSMAENDVEKSIAETDVLSDNEKVSAMEAYQNILATQSDPEFEHEESLTKDFTTSGKKITRKRSSMRTGMKSKRVASAAAVKKALGEKSIAENDVEKSIAENDVEKSIAENDEACERGTKWIPIDMWQKQGISAEYVVLGQDMVLERSETSIRLREGEKVMVVTSERGKYIQLGNGDLVSIKSNLF